MKWLLAEDDDDENDENEDYDDCGATDGHFSFGIFKPCLSTKPVSNNSAKYA